MKLLEGYVENRTKELALVAVFAALTLIGRYITLPIFIPPLKGLEPSAAFYCSAILVSSYPYVWLFSFILALTAGFPLPAFPCFLIGLNIFYFLSRLMGLRKARYFSFFCVPINCIIVIIIMGSWMRIIPPEIFFVPLMVKAFAQGIIAVIFVPLIIKLFEKFLIISLVEEGRL